MNIYKKQAKGNELYRLQQHQSRGVTLMREAIDLPFTEDKAAWEAWCKSWAARAETWIAEAKS